MLKRNLRMTDGIFPVTVVIQFFRQKHCPLRQQITCHGHIKIFVVDPRSKLQFLPRIKIPPEKTDPYRGMPALQLSGQQKKISAGIDLLKTRIVRTIYRIFRKVGKQQHFRPVLFCLFITMLQQIRLDPVITVQKIKIFSRCHCRACIPRAGQIGFLPCDYLEAIVLFRILLKNGSRSVSRSVIHADGFPICKSLCQ